MKKKSTDKQQSYVAVGLMSGTSLDGLDMALCRFVLSAGEWQMEIVKTETLTYSAEWKQRLAGSMDLNGLELMELHRDFGRFTGRSVKAFLEEAGKKPDLIASHGHTVFHQPGAGLTLQIGDGAEIASLTGIPTVSDFRRLDVALGGQGAPLVPAGDELLFGKYTYCLNLGGFANISFRESNKRIAFDICPANIVLNALAGYAGKSYDHNGELARKGIVDRELLDTLDNLDYYRLDGPRSLGKEWVDEVFMPALNLSGAGTEDKLRTVCEHIALRVAEAASKKPSHRSIINEKEESSLSGERSSQAREKSFLTGEEPSLSGERSPRPVKKPSLSGERSPRPEKKPPLSGERPSQYGERSSRPGEEAPFPEQGSSLQGSGGGKPNMENRQYEQNSEFLEQGNDGPATMLITGGGARNNFLVRLIAEKAGSIYTVIPEEELVDFKEAAVFAFLGVLRTRNEVNCLSSVTGARKDNSGGIVHIP